MNRDKQIEEMADILCDAKGHDCNGGDDCRCVKQAEALYNAGYCKATDVAREIFEDIEDVLNNIGYFDELDFNALKKKYIQSEGVE